MTRDRGTVVVVQGPRFSTRAESAHHAAQGWEVVNMTQMPEAVLARELGLCYVSIALITDHDVGLRLRAVPGPDTVVTSSDGTMTFVGLSLWVSGIMHGQEAAV